MKLPHCVTCKTAEDLMPKPYSKHKNKDGVVTSVGYMCRACNTARKQRYRQTENGRRIDNQAQYAANRRHRVKTNARAKVFAAVSNGTLRKPTLCTTCLLEKRLDAHHSDYRRPLEVKWLCRQCHADLHRTLKAD